MNVLLELRDSDIFPGSLNIDPSGFSEKETARAVILNSLGHIALLHVRKYNYFKLPGGGIEDGEDARTALERELFEEIGCTARIITEIGVIIEYKNEQRKKQTSYCYLGEKNGDALPPALTEGENANDYEVVWPANVDTAISLVESGQPVKYTRKFIRARELAFLRAAKQLIS